MDTPGHKIEDYRNLRHKIQALIDEGIITIDLLSPKYEINDRPKANKAPILVLIDIPLQILLLLANLDRVILELKPHRISTPMIPKSSNKVSLRPNQPSSLVTKSMG